MSAQLDRIQQRRRNKRHYEKHKDTPEYRSRKAHEQAKRRRARRLSESYTSDDIRALDEKNARIEKRLSALQSTTARASDREDPVAEDDANNSEIDDDFDDEPEFDDCESADEPWTTDNLQRVYSRCIDDDRRCIAMTGLPRAVYADVFARVEPVLRHTRYDGKPRVQVRSNSRMSDHLQFFLFATWLRQVRTHRFVRGNEKK